MNQILLGLIRHTWELTYTRLNWRAVFHSISYLVIIRYRTVHTMEIHANFFTPNVSGNPVDQISAISARISQLRLVPFHHRISSSLGWKSLTYLLFNDSGPSFFLPRIESHKILSLYEPEQRTVRVPWSIILIKVAEVVKSLWRFLSWSSPNEVGKVRDN